jgi:GntR family transcriptional regulator
MSEKFPLTRFGNCIMLTSTVSEVPVEFIINPSSRLPICRQLSQQIREAVARGRLRPDERLPSVRELSRQLVVNPNTVARVYGDLQREGVLNARPGLGFFVAQPGSELSQKVRRQRLRDALDAFLTEAVHLGFTADEVAALFLAQVKQFQWFDKEGAP